LDYEAADHSKQSVAPVEIKETFKILVDGVEHSRYDAKEWNYITVGSATDATVRLPWADQKLIDIHPMSDRDFLVEIHGDNSIVVPKIWSKKRVRRVRDPNWRDGRKVYVRSGSLIKIMGHTIQAVDIPKHHLFGSGCWTCGQTEECTCGVS
jgi:hypothetical protein